MSYNFTKDDMRKGGKNSQKTRHNDIENLDWNLLIEKYNYKQIKSTSLLKKRVLIEQKYKCNMCGLSKQMGNNIPLEIHHKDSNKNNIKRENIEALCPNCHYFTDNYKFRGRTHGGMT